MIIKLIGIVIIVVGFILKLDTISIVLLAGIVTGLVSDMSIIDILSFLGTAFIENRYTTLLLLTLATIGLLERNGLKEQATKCILKIKNATVGKIFSIYLFIRTITGALSIKLGGHVEFIRPLIYPMAKGMIESNKIYNKKIDEEIKGVANSMENYGNFFGQNLFLASPGILLAISTLNELGIKNIDGASFAIATIPIAITSFIVGAIRNYLLDLKIKRLIKDLKN